MPTAAATSAPRPGLSRNPTLVAFVVALTVVQACYAYVYAHSPWLRAHSVVQVVERLMTWTLPAILIMWRSVPDVLDALRLRRNVVRGVTWGCVIGAAIVVLNVAATWIFKGHVRLQPGFGTAVFWRATVLVGFSEDVVYRGFLLRELAGRTTFWRANLLQAVLFLLVHVPGWLLLGQFVFPGIVRLVAFVFAFGLFLGWIWKKTDSLWACMIVHSFNNFASLSIL